MKYTKLKPLNIFNTVRFKLTLIYSTILFVFSCSLVFGINLIVGNHYRQPPTIPRRISENFPIVRDITEIELERINEIRTRDLKKLRQISFLSLIPLSIGSFAIGYSVSGMFLSPINSIVKSMSMLDADGKKHKLTYYTNSNDEIGRLVTSYNQMVDRIDSTFNSQKQFIQDASHEIKTPLAIIQTNLDTLLADETATKAELTKGIENSLVGVESLNHLIEQLLSFSLIENRTVEQFDIVELILNELNAIDVTKYNEKVEVSSNVQTLDKIMVSGDKFGISRVVFNLLENAFKYSATEKKPIVQVELTKHKTKFHNYLLTISNNGAAIPQNDLTKIFERFYRVDKSRSRNSGSFGLGLAIVKKVVEAHNWKIKAESDKKLTKFKIYFG